MGNRQSMEDHMFNLRFNAKQLQREAAKCDKSAASNKLKCKTAIEKGNIDGARIFAESAIRDKNQSLNYYRLSSRIEAVAQRVQTAVRMKTLTGDMSGIVGSMNSAMKSMNVEKISSVMDQFEQQFTNLDLSTQFMENSIQSSTNSVMPESQVDLLMKQVADEYNLEFNDTLTGAGNKQLSNKQSDTQKQTDDNKEQQQSLEERLKKLQG